MSFDTEHNPEHLLWEINVGSPAIIAFAGMARGLNELANFEFMKTMRDFSFTKIFVKDPFGSFYHNGIDDETNSIPKLAERIKDILREAQTSKLACVGVSAGGTAALIMGHLLNANTVHAFGPQTILYRSWGIENDDSTVYRCEGLHSRELSPEEDFRDLKKVLSSPNDRSKYYIHIGRSECDERHANHMIGVPNVEILRHDCEGHACASHVLRRDGKLGQLIFEAVQ